MNIPRPLLRVGVIETTTAQMTPLGIVAILAILFREEINHKTSVDKGIQEKKAPGPGLALGPCTSAFKGCQPITALFSISLHICV
jgi:hypothetical protein